MFPFFYMVVLGYFMRRVLENKTDVKWPVLLRVYGELAEHLDFLVPGEPISPTIKFSKTIAKANKALRRITLHHKIRKPSNTYSQEIKRYDRRFKQHPHRLTKEDIKNFQNLIGKACKEEISKAHIIFCTCTNSAAKKFKKCTYWKQVHFIY